MHPPFCLFLNQIGFLPSNLVANIEFGLSHTISLVRIQNDYLN